MGQAKRRRDRFFEQHPHCCYCGGATIATTLDHVPAKTTFWGKRRPAGLESPSCDTCNGGTRKLERAAGIFSHIRMTDNRTPAQQQEHRHLAHRVQLDFPGWVDEFHVVPDHPHAAILPPKVQPFNVGPLMLDALCVVAAKLAFALHYSHTGKIVPPRGYVAVRFDTHVTLQARPYSPDLLDALGPPQMLAQGKHTSAGHFAWRPSWVPDGSASMFIAHLGEAFHFLMYAVGLDPTTSEPALSESELSGFRLYRPGDLQKADAQVWVRYHAPPTIDSTAGAHGEG